jgi:4-hydroxy-tetrahydrodipicolinate reductase
MLETIVVGAAGRMGRMIVQTLVAADDMTCIGAIEAPGHPLTGTDIGEVVGLGRLGLAIGEDLAAIIDDGDVIIDFTSAEASVRNIALAAQHVTPIVIGSTGFSTEQINLLRTYAQQIPCVWSPNMSLGVNVLFRVVQQIARALGDDYDVEIIEAHHRLKKDAPSGTALRLGEVIAGALDRPWDDVAVYARHGMIGQRSDREIGIQAVRAGDMVGEHTVLFGGTGERLEVTHRAHSRNTFARGAMRAAAWIVGRPPGFYDMDDVLGLTASSNS